MMTANATGFVFTCQLLGGSLVMGRKRRLTGKKALDGEGYSQSSHEELIGCWIEDCPQHTFHVISPCNEPVELIFTVSQSLYYCILNLSHCAERHSPNHLYQHMLTVLWREQSHLELSSSLGWDRL